MSTNPKGAGRVRGFLLLHCEKIVFGLVGVLALMIVYKSFNLPRLDDEHQADALQREITHTRNDISGFTWDDALSNHPDKIKIAKTIALKGNFQVEAQAYVNGGDPNGKMLVGFDSAVVAPMIARTDPPVLNAFDVYATGGTGMFAFADEEIRKQRQLRRATEAAELAENEEEKANLELYRQQMGQSAGRGGRGGRSEGPADPSNQPYDPDHPKRRPIDASVRLRGVRLQGDERVERAYWACVVAKVPIREQLKRYQDLFEKARGYDVGRDFPQYLGFFIERAEVLPGKKLEWQRVPLFDGQQKSIAANSPLSIGPHHAIGMSVVDALYAAAAQFWAGGGSPEVVDARFMERVLTLPLPPLVGRDWGSEATHPDIRLNLPPLEEDAEQPVMSTTDQEPNTMASEFGSWNSNMAAGPRGFGTSAGRYAPRTMRLGGMSPDGYRPGSRRFASGASEPAGGYPGGVGAVSKTGLHTNLAWGVDYYLLRFFDYTVEPAKKYRYRVKLAIADPNYNMPTNTLAPTVLDRQAESAKANNGRRPIFRIAEAWSDPSPTVGIPIGGSIRLADVKVPSADKFNDEPSVGLLIEAFALDEKGNAIQAGIEEKDFRRGYVANLVKDTEYVGPGYIDTQEKFQFLTGMTLLDIAGGTKLTRDISAPARILLMGPAGQLYIRNEVEDEPFVEYHRLLFEKPNRNNHGPGGRIARGSG